MTTYESVADKHTRQREGARRAEPDLAPRLRQRWEESMNGGLDLRQALSLFKQGQLWGAMMVAGGVGLGVMLSIVVAYLKVVIMP